MRRGLALAGLAVVAAFGVTALRRSPPPSTPAAAPRAAVSPTPPASIPEAPTAAAASPVPVRTAAHRRPDSLRGTQVDGGLAVDAAGRFVPTTDAIALFDYFFSARGEESDAAIVRRIRREIEARLPASAVADALAFLDLYLGYRERARVLAAMPETADLAARLARLHALRAEVFGAALAATLFAQDEQRVAAALERRRILADPALDDAERVRRLEAVEAALPEEMRAAQAEAEAPLALWYEEARLRASGGDDAAVHALRESRFGPEAAARLAELDAQRAVWDARLRDYRVARDALTADTALAAGAKTAALAALLAERFDANERVRVEALDRIAAGAGAPAPAGAATAPTP